MVQLRGTRLYFVLVGVLVLVLSLTFVICTNIVLETYSEGSQWYSLFYLFYAIPGLLCILSGVTTSSTVYIKASIGFHIISVVVSTIGAAVSSVFWQRYKEPDACGKTTTGECVCFQKSLAISCKDGDVSRVLLSVLTAANILMIMTSFIGSILACTNVCCDPVQSDNPVSRNDTSHSEQTVVTGTNHVCHNNTHEPVAICLNSVETSIELRNYNEPSST